jgi:putative pyruvate formate lyase activating enzyme
MRIDECRLCPRECGVKREEEKGAGICQSGTLARVARAGLHFWEEPCISGKRGSGTVFFSGCPLRCVYCQNYNISQENYGLTVKAEDLAQIFTHLQQLGAHNLNLVTPTHFALAIIRALQMSSLTIPVVYNTSSYEKLETLDLLESYTDIYLADIKYVSSDLSDRYSRCRDYFEIARRAIDKMMRQKGEALYNEDGMMERGVLLRHLILPKHTKESKKVIDYICAQYGKHIPFSLMSQYTPNGRLSSFLEIDRKLTKREYAKVVDYALQKGMKNVRPQSLTSADETFIPVFDLTGTKRN